MSKILVTGGTVFVSKYIAKYYVEKGENVFVLNRNTRSQVKGVTLIEADRKRLNGILNEQEFDVVIDVNVYTSEDINNLLDDIGGFKEYVMISSSAVYPETNSMPFTEEQEVGENRFWGKYGTDKIAAENMLRERVPNAYILRPPYLYGPMNNVYREAFVFDCALNGRKFYLPQDGEMKLQFLHIRDLCLIIDSILYKKPDNHVFNVGNEETISVYDWVKLCYDAVGSELEVVNVKEDIEQRNYFPFYNYEDELDVSKQKELVEIRTSLKDGMKESFQWYVENKEEVCKREYFNYIDNNLEM